MFELQPGKALHGRQERILTFRHLHFKKTHTHTPFKTDGLHLKSRLKSRLSVITGHNLTLGQNDVSTNILCRKMLFLAEVSPFVSG